MEFHAPLAFGSQRFTEGQMFQKMHSVFDEIANLVRGSTIVMTDNKAFTTFLQSKLIPTKLRNYCDQALQFNFLIAQVSGTANPATDYLLRLNKAPEERIHRHKLHHEIPVYHVASDLSSKTTKQDEQGEDFIPDDDVTTSKQTDPINDILGQVQKATTNRVNSFTSGSKPSVIRSRRSSLANIKR